MKKLFMMYVCLVVMLFNIFTEENMYSVNIGTLIYVPEGSYLRNNNEEDITALDSYYLSACEITQEQFVKITGLKNPSKNKKIKNGPVESVSWYKAIVFCNRLSILEGLTPVYSILESTNPSDWGKIPKTKNTQWNEAKANWEANGYRLPTAAEWYWAALGARRNKFPFFSGAAVGPVQDVSWYIANSGNSKHPVGTKLPNELGLYDMSGNVYELVWAATSTGKKGLLENPLGDPNPNNFRSICGGSYNATLKMLYVMSSLPISAEDGYQIAGFRVARKSK